MYTTPLLFYHARWRRRWQLRCQDLRWIPQRGLGCLGVNNSRTSFHKSQIRPCPWKRDIEQNLHLAAGSNNPIYLMQCRRLNTTIHRDRKTRRTVSREDEKLVFFSYLVRSDVGIGGDDLFVRCQRPVFLKPEITQGTRHAEAIVAPGTWMQCELTYVTFGLEYWRCTNSCRRKPPARVIRSSSSGMTMELGL